MYFKLPHKHEKILFDTSLQYRNIHQLLIFFASKEILPNSFAYRLLEVSLLFFFKVAPKFDIVLRFCSKETHLSQFLGQS